MSLAAAIEAMRGQPYQLILETLRQQTEPAIGKIRGDKIKLLQSFIGATGLRARLANATAEQVNAASAISEAIHPAYLAAEESFSINLADPQVAGLLAGAAMVGLMSAPEVAFLNNLATYQKPRWPDVTMRDVVNHFEPELVANGSWNVLGQVNSNRLMLQTTVAMPEPTAVRIEMRESHDGQHWTAWRRVAHFMDVTDAGIYYQLIPNNGLQREIRWRGEFYNVVGSVEAV
jgi:hypothetical protein